MVSNGMSDTFCIDRNLHFCRLSDSVVFLDAQNDRYFAFSAIWTELFMQICESGKSELSKEATSFAYELVARNILTTDSTMGRELSACSTIPPRWAILDEWTEAGPKITLYDILIFLRAIVEVKLLVMFSGKSTIRRVFDRAQAWKAAAGQNNPSSARLVIHDTRVFHRLTTFFLSAHDECFFRSVLLFRYLCRKGLCTELQIGVRNAPFRAHCWVSFEGIVLNDFLDSVLEFTPILSI